MPHGRARADTMAGKIPSDLCLGEAQRVIEKVPYGELSKWCHCMVVTRKSDVTSHITVDLSPPNHYYRREPLATDSLFHLTRRVPPNAWKTVSDAWNGYNSVPLREADRHLTTFTTPFGRWR